jgi:nicotinate-nucleotide pyrophosphorylase (carboxylating)
MQILNWFIHRRVNWRSEATTAVEVAASGVDLLSVGWITHSAPVLDIGLDYI